ncbi:hypothetical protein RR46_04395 [Papilio xuthus]|uniref:Uncharacterized protein n=1 Tax=Papilio xuthus TaxID=66420 RepID=A0A194PLX3_PAPXU|nr:hypothetical protein RR46_04395 [Papilio xuthus]
MMSEWLVVGLISKDSSRSEVGCRFTGEGRSLNPAPIVSGIGCVCSVTIESGPTDVGGALARCWSSRRLDRHGYIDMGTDSSRPPPWPPSAASSPDCFFLPPPAPMPTMPRRVPSRTFLAARKHRKPKAVCWWWGEDLVVAGGERGGGGEAAAPERGEATRAPHAAAFARPPCRAPSAPPRTRRDV